MVLAFLVGSCWPLGSSGAPQRAKKPKKEQTCAQHESNSTPNLQKSCSPSAPQAPGPDADMSCRRLLNMLQCPKYATLPRYATMPQYATISNSYQLLPTNYCRPCLPTTAYLLLPTYYCLPTTAYLLLRPFQSRPRGPVPHVAHVSIPIPLQKDLGAQVAHAAIPIPLQKGPVGPWEALVVSAGLGPYGAQGAP